MVTDSMYVLTQLLLSLLVSYKFCSPDMSRSCFCFSKVKLIIVLKYDGSSMIVCNGKVLACGTQFSLDDVEVVTAVVDLEEIRSFRSSPSRGMQAQLSQKFPRIELDVRLSKRADDRHYRVVGASDPIDLKYHTPEEEIALGGACWLWDYLRRSHSAGFFM